MNETILPEDRLRGNFYSLMARLLAGPPDAALLATLHRIPTGAAQEGRMGDAWAQLRKAALETDPDTETAEYDRLFCGISGRTVLPYASWYRTGGLAGLPLANIRKDLIRLGFQRAEGVAETEDHAAALCETMTILCQDPLHAASEQADFFSRHLAAWIESFLSDLTRTAETAYFKAVGTIGQAFFNIEKQYLGVEPGTTGQDFRIRTYKDPGPKDPALI